MGGLRVSDEVVIDAVTNVIAGSVNKQLVSALIAAGCTAVGLSGVDGSLTDAHQYNPDLGFVGKPQTTDPRLLNVLSQAGFLPVVACIAGDKQGRVYNVNADQMAVSCAVGWRAERLLFLTDVPGVKGPDGEVMQQLTVHQVDELVASKVAHGGMQAKLEAAVAALASGLQQVIIAPGHQSDICRRLLAGEPVGTRLVSGPAVQANSVQVSAQ